MGNISNAERARRAAALAEQDAQADAEEQVTEPEPKPDLTGLIKVSKGGEVLYVHPSALLQHKQLGWLEQ